MYVVFRFFQGELENNMNLFRLLPTTLLQRIAHPQVNFSNHVEYNAEQ